MIEKDYYNGWNDEGNLNKILSCPFCGGNGELLDNGYEHPVIDENGAYVDMDIFEGDTFWIECEKCGAMMTEADTPEKAIEEWNKRTGSGWIPVEERLPEKEYYTALCVTDKNHYCVAVHNREYGFRTGDIDVEGEIIAWMPLPEPYRSEPLETRKNSKEGVEIMSYIDCPCYSCTERTTGAKRVACHPDCEKFATWKAKQQKAREKKKKDKPYRSDTMAKSIKRKQMNQKAGRR